MLDKIPESQQHIHPWEFLSKRQNLWIEELVNNINKIIRRNKNKEIEEIL